VMSGTLTRSVGTSPPLDRGNEFPIRSTWGTTSGLGRG